MAIYASLHASDNIKQAPGNGQLYSGVTRNCEVELQRHKMYELGDTSTALSCLAGHCKGESVKTKIAIDVTCPAQLPKMLLIIKGDCIQHSHSSLLAQQQKLGPHLPS